VAVIENTTTISQEVRRGEVFGAVKLYNLDDPTQPESSARRILGMTYPTQALQQAMLAIQERIEGRRKQGTFVFAGDYGTGKSHSLLALYHLLTSPDEGQRWLDKWGLSFSFLGGMQAAVSHLLIEDPDFAWAPIFTRLGRADLLAGVRDHPTGDHIRRLVGDKPLVIILDELESWFGPIEDPSRRERNLNFLQNLTEMAQDQSLRLIVLASLYGRHPQLLGRMGRERMFLKDLGAEEDKARVVLFRLFEEIDQDEARRTVDDYVDTYAAVGDQAGIPASTLDSYRARMFTYYPLHPDLIDVLFQVYGACKDYQNTRGILYILSGVLRRCADERDLLLPSDVDPGFSEVNDDLYQLDPVLLARAVDDIQRNKDELLARDILATILLHSFVPEMAGADESQVFLGCLRPGLNVNELRRVLDKLEANAWYLWRSEDRYVIRAEENLPVSINARAARQLQDKESQAAALKLRELIADLAGGTSTNTFIYPLDEIVDGRQMKVVISTKYMDDQAIRDEVYFGKEWRNTLVFVRPKSAGDLTQNTSLLISAQRLLVCDDLKDKLEKGKQPQLARYREREEGDLCAKLKNAYGEWMKPGGRGDKIYFRPIECNLDTTAILSQVREAFGAEVLDDAIRAELEAVAEEGKRFDELRLSFLKLLGKPVLVEPEDLRKRVRALCNEAGEIVMVRGRTFYSQQNPAAVNFADDAVLYLKQYGPLPVEEVEIAEAGHPRVEYPEEKVPERKEEIGAKELRPGRQVVVRTEAYATPFSLQTDVEGKLRSGDRVTHLEVTLEGQNLEEAGSLSELLSELRSKGGQTQASLKLDLTLASPQQKQDILKLLDRLPIPVEGKVSATLEVESEEAS
jgi:hypothetical protein